MSCQHAEDVCQHCLEKVQTTPHSARFKKMQQIGAKMDKIQKELDDLQKEEEEEEEEEDSPRKYSLPFMSKLILFPVVSSFLAGSAFLWVISNEMLFTAGKMAVKLITTPTE